MRPIQFVLIALTVFCSAQPKGNDIYVPPDLEPWQEWVLHDHKTVDCPLSGGVPACVWPGRLEMSVNDQGGEFSQRIESFAEQVFFLPGNAANWPLDVTVNGERVPVLEFNKRPAVRLAKGDQSISGSFAWSSKPDRLPIGNGTALLNLSVDGVRIERPRMTGSLLLFQKGQSSTEEESRNQINVNVYRLIKDGAPMTIILRLQLEISGDSREETIGRLVPEGFEPAKLIAPLPARLDDNGNLKIQARPGTWNFELQAHRLKPQESFTFKPSGEHWPQEEIWSYQSNSVVRATEVRAENPVDPTQVGVPGEWHEFPAFRVVEGDVMQVVERQRGRAEGEQNQLSLNRQLWLDFDRGGYTARDTLLGSVVKDWRLNLYPPFSLKSAQLTGNDGQKDDLLVTQLQNASQINETHSGVEIRVPTINLSAIARIDNRAVELPVAGWDTRFNSVNTTVFLPPGHRLVKATGVDVDTNSWSSHWDLLDFFLVLIVSVAAWRLYAPWLGVVALLAMTLSIHEAGAPQWAWLNLIAALAFVRLLPAGRLLQMANLYRFVSIGALVVILLPFVTTQLKVAVFPQLERSGGILDYYDRQSGIAPSRPMIDTSIQDEAFNTRDAMKSVAKSRASVSDLEEVVVTSGRSSALNRYEKSAKVQTGPGVPSWSWQQYSMRSSGPIDMNQTMQLWIAPPLLMRLWRVMMVILLAAFLGGLVKRSLASVAISTKAASSAAAIFLSLMVAALPPIAAEAQTPSPEILDTLRNRLLEAPDCAPQCVEISRSKVNVGRNELSIELIAHADSNAAVSLPGTLGGWMPTAVLLNGQTHDSVRLTNEGTVQISVGEGVHSILLSGPLPNASSVVVTFPLNPRHVQVRSDGWEVSGISNHLLSGGSLTMVRQQDSAAAKTMDEIDNEQFPTFVVVERRLRFDLDWSVKTNVYRRTPETAAVNLTVPLLPGESVTTENVVVKDGDVQVNLPTGVKVISWTSTLSRAPQITLVAQENKPWQNSWRIETGASWRLEHTGVPELNIDRNQDSNWVARFWPWPGESLVLNLSRPVAIDGSTLAIDNASLTNNIGRRSSTATLTFDYRATRGGQHLVTLPSGSELIRITIDGKQQNLALEKNQLRLPITPGAHQVYAQWRHAMSQSLVNSSTEVDLGISASNLTSRIELSRDRWVLWTNGPRLGPAVLYWSEILALIAIAFLLAKMANTPLRWRHWILLGLGFSTFFWPAFLIVAAALIALAWRERHIASSRLLFNSTQFGLAFLTFAAAIALVTTIPLGLLGTPDMHVTGNQSNAFYLQWFLDRTAGPMPVGSVVSAPLWVYKALILLWALWLAFALVRWLPWMWKAFSKDGYWRSKPVIIDEPLPSDVIEGS